MIMVRIIVPALTPSILEVAGSHIYGIVAGQVSFSEHRAPLRANITYSSVRPIEQRP